jgi:NADH-quinone oxidoreductase subunit A
MSFTTLSVDGALPSIAQAAPTLGYDLSVVLVFTLFGIAFVVVTVAVLSRLLRPSSRPENEPAKAETYECGEPAIGSSWVRFDIRFYTVALVFLIFDVEVLFLYPWAVVFKGLRAEHAGLFVFFEMMVFVGILLAGFVYCWKRGDLDWVKTKTYEPAGELVSVDEVSAQATAPEPSGDVETGRKPAVAGVH